MRLKNKVSHLCMIDHGEQWTKSFIALRKLRLFLLCTKLRSGAQSKKDILWLLGLEVENAVHTAFQGNALKIFITPCYTHWRVSQKENEMDGATLLTAAGTVIAIQDAIWKIATNATSALCADFYDSIKEGVEKAMEFKNL